MPIANEILPVLYASLRRPGIENAERMSDITTESNGGEFSPRATHTERGIRFGDGYNDSLALVKPGSQK